MNKLLVLLLAFSTFPSCKTVPDKDCGAFRFQVLGTQTIGNNDELLNVQLEFDFDPSVCGSSCNCTAVAFIQLAKVTRKSTGELLIDPAFTPLLTDRGYHLDRSKDREWPWFGRNNGITFPKWHAPNTPGTNFSPAVLADSPGAGKGLLWTFISAPICIEGPCEGAVLGFYQWSFSTNTAGNVDRDANGAPIVLHSDDKSVSGGTRYVWEELQDAAAKWNAAPGKRPIPPLYLLDQQP